VFLFIRLFSIKIHHALIIRSYSRHPSTLAFMGDRPLAFVGDRSIGVNILREEILGNDLPTDIPALLNPLVSSIQLAHVQPETFLS
jgi:hypothetical protein